MARRPINITIRDITGEALSGATVTVRVHETGALATVYASESTLTPLTNSETTTGSTGFIPVWIDDADYNLLTMFDVYGVKSGYSIPTKTYNA